MVSTRKKLNQQGIAELGFRLDKHTVKQLRGLARVMDIGATWYNHAKKEEIVNRIMWEADQYGAPSNLLAEIASEVGLGFSADTFPIAGEIDPRFIGCQYFANNSKLLYPGSRICRWEEFSYAPDYLEAIRGDQYLSPYEDDGVTINADFLSLCTEVMSKFGSHAAAEFPHDVEWLRARGCEPKDGVLHIWFVTYGMKWTVWNRDATSNLSSLPHNLRCVPARLADFDELQVRGEYDIPEPMLEAGTDTDASLTYTYISAHEPAQIPGVMTEPGLKAKRKSITTNKPAQTGEPMNTDPTPAQTTSSVQPSQAGGLEGVLGGVIRDNVGATVREQLEQMGITQASVKSLITEVIADKALPQVVARRQPEPGEPPFMLVHMNYEAAKFWLDMGQSVYLNGPAGSGKTVAAQQLAEQYGRPCTIISCHGEMTVYDLCGYRDGHGNYNTTPFHDAWVNGDIILVDEVDKSPGEVNVFLNAATAQGVITFPDGAQVNKHDECKIILTGNTKMSGADAAYSAGQRQDGSFSNRLVAIDWPYDDNLEQALAEQEAIKWGNNPASSKAQGRAAHNRIKKIREAVASLGMTYIVGQRQTMMAAAGVATGRNEDLVFNEVVYNWMDPRDAERVKEKV